METRTSLKPGALASAEDQPRARDLALVDLDVLLVEDDPAVARALARLVERRGGRAAIASSVEGARALAARQAPDVVLLDLEVIGGVGLELVEDLHRSRTTFLVHTGYAAMYVDSCLRAGAWDVLDKPSNPEQVIAAIHEGALRSRRLRARFPPPAAEGEAGPPPPEPREPIDARVEQALALFEDLALRVRRAVLRRTRPGHSRVVEVAVLSVLGLGVKQIAWVTRTSTSNVNQCISLIRDRAGWHSPHDALRWYLAEVGVNFGRILPRWLSDRGLIQRALRELGVTPA